MYVIISVFINQFQTLDHSDADDKFMEKLKLGLSISGGILAFVIITGIIILITWCLSANYQKRISPSPQGHVTLIEESKPLYNV